MVYLGGGVGFRKSQFVGFLLMPRGLCSPRLRWPVCGAVLQAFLCYVLPSVALAQSWLYTDSNPPAEETKADFAAALDDGGAIIWGRAKEGSQWRLRIDAEGRPVGPPAPYFREAFLAFASSPHQIDQVVQGDSSWWCTLGRGVDGLDYRAFEDSVILGPEPVRLSLTRGRFALHPSAENPDARALSWFGPDCRRREVVATPDRSLTTIATSFDGRSAFVLRSAGAASPAALLRASADGVLWTRELAPSSEEDANGVLSIVALQDGGAYLTRGHSIERYSANGERKWAAQLPRLGAQYLVGGFGQSGPSTVVPHGNGAFAVFHIESRFFASSRQELAGLDEDGAISWLAQLDELHLLRPLSSASASGLWVVRSPSRLDQPADTPRDYGVARVSADGTLQMVLQRSPDAIALAELSDARLLVTDREQRRVVIRDLRAGSVKSVNTSVPGWRSVLAVHDADSEAYVITSSQTGRFQLQVIDASGRAKWRADLEQPFGEDRARGVRIATAHGASQFCLLATKPGELRLLTCFDRRDGTRTFRRRDQAVEQYFSPAIRVAIDGSVRVIDVLSKGPSAGGFGTDWVIGEQAFSASGAALSSSSSRVLPTDSSTMVVSAPDGESHWIFGKSADSGLNYELSRHGHDGRELWRTRLAQGVGRLLARSPDGDTLLGSDSVERFPSLQLIDSAGQVRWTLQSGDTRQYLGDAQAAGLPGGDWILLEQEFKSRTARITRLSRNDGHAIWERQLSLPLDPYADQTLSRSFERAPRLAVLRVTPDSKVILRAVSDTSTRVLVLDALANAWVGAQAQPKGLNGHIAVADAARYDSQGESVLTASVLADGNLVVSKSEIGDLTGVLSGGVVSALTGAWHHVDTPGQGFLLQTTPGLDAVYGAWFTYTQEGGHQGSEQRWFSLHGEVVPGDNAPTLKIYRHSGGKFAVGPQVAGELVGEATVKLLDCNRAMLAYQFFASVNEGTSAIIPLQRTAGEVSECGSVGAAKADPRAGSWYDPATSGQGILIDEFTQGGTLGYAGAWFTFDPEGVSDDPTSQHWFTLLAEGGGAPERTRFSIYRTVGGSFDSGQTNNSWKVGVADLSVNGCATATLSYQFDSGDVAAGFEDLRGVIALSKIGGCP